MTYTVITPAGIAYRGTDYAKASKAYDKALRAAIGTGGTVALLRNE